MQQQRREAQLAAYGYEPSYQSSVEPSAKSLAKQQAEPTGTDSAFGWQNRSVASVMTPPNVAFGPAVTTVPGLMSSKGLRRNLNLYSKSSRKRMGFPNPLGTTLRI
jgi:hypothetical protein